MCLYPKLIKNKKYTSNKKNGGKIPEIKDERAKMVPVGCGKCMECLKMKARAWQIRMTEEIRVNKNAKFITLTFNENSIKELRKIVKEKSEKIEINQKAKIEENEIATIAMRRFLERWRKLTKKSVKHWMVTELGHTGTERIHLHGILFTNKNKEEIEEIWKYGIIWMGEYVNEKTINYIIKYISKTDKDHKEYTPTILCSAGLGKNYLEREDSKKNKYKEGGTIETYKYRNGYKSNLPIYYRNKIYSEDEREKLWMEKLDKNIRWVGGEKIDISKSEEVYYKLLKFYQEKNERLGYGNDKKTWFKTRYMKERKRLQKDSGNIQKKRPEAT